MERKAGTRQKGAIAGRVKKIKNSFGFIYKLNQSRFIFVHRFTLTHFPVMHHIQALHIQEIAQLNAGIAYCNEAICSKNTEEWERKEYRALKLERMKRKITLIKILKNWV